MIYEISSHFLYDVESSMLLASFVFGEFGFVFYAIPALRFVGKEKNAGNLTPEILDTRK